MFVPHSSPGMTLCAPSLRRSLATGSATSGNFSEKRRWKRERERTELLYIWALYIVLTYKTHVCQLPCKSAPTSSSYRGNPHHLPVVFLLAGQFDCDQKLVKNVEAIFHEWQARPSCDSNIRGLLSTAHRISPNISLTVPGIETQHRKKIKSVFTNFKSKFTDQTIISECIEFYRLVFVQRPPGS